MTKPSTRKKQPDELRETLLSVRMNRAETEALDGWAASHGVNRSEAARQLIALALRRSRPRGRDAAPAMDPDTVRALAELTNPSVTAINRLGNVTDQVARKLHTGGTVSERRVIELLDAFEDVKDEQRRIGAILSVAIQQNTSTEDES